MSKLQHIYNKKLEELNKIKAALEIEKHYSKSENIDEKPHIVIDILPKPIAQNFKQETISVPIDLKAINILNKNKASLKMRRYEAIKPNEAYVIIEE